MPALSSVGIWPWEQSLTQATPARRSLITGFGTPETELWADGPVDDYLIKPFSTYRLLRRVQRLMSPPTRQAPDA